MLFSKSVRTFACATRSRDSNVTIARARWTSVSTAIPSSPQRKKTTWLSRIVSLGTDNLDNPIAAQPTISRQKTCHATLDQGSTRSYRSNPVPGLVLDRYRVTSRVPEAINAPCRLSITSPQRYKFVKHPTRTGPRPSPALNRTWLHAINNGDAAEWRGWCNFSQ